MRSELSAQIWNLIGSQMVPAIRKVRLEPCCQSEHWFTFVSNTRCTTVLQCIFVFFYTNEQNIQCFLNALVINLKKMGKSSSLQMHVITRELALFGLQEEQRTKSLADPGLVRESRLLNLRTVFVVPNVVRFLNRVQLYNLVVFIASVCYYLFGNRFLIKTTLLSNKSCCFLEHECLVFFFDFDAKLTLWDTLCWKRFLPH